MKERVYVCHTIYHVYVTLLKEFKYMRERQGKATVVLSRMSNDFKDIDVRLKESGLFEDIIWFDEKRAEFFPELDQYKVKTSNFLKAIYNRIQFTRKLACLEEKYIPINFREYKDIYVFCDADPIGYYLNQNKIKYHAIEDGLDTLVHVDEARYDNIKFFGLKRFLSEKLNLIFIQNGYGKYCIDMEVNNIGKIKYPCPKYIEQSRAELVQALQENEKEILLKIFIKDIDSLIQVMSFEKTLNAADKRVLVLTEPLCDLETRRQIFADIIEKYCGEAQVYIKPHPRDELDYNRYFGQYTVFQKEIPMEILNFLPGVCFDEVYAVLTVIDGIQFAKKKIRLGADFMDAYEDPMIHRQNEQI